MKSPSRSQNLSCREIIPRTNHGELWIQLLQGLSKHLQSHPEYKIFKRPCLTQPTSLSNHWTWPFFIFFSDWAPYDKPQNYIHSHSRMLLDLYSRYMNPILRLTSNQRLIASMLRFHITLFRRILIKQTNSNKCWWECRQREPVYTSDGMYPNSAIMKSNMGLKGKNKRERGEKD